LSQLLQQLVGVIDLGEGSAPTLTATMTVDAVFEELKAIYKETLSDERPVARLRNADISRWSGNLGISRAALYDLLAIRLAFGFARNEFPFLFCDYVVNDIHARITLADEIRPPLFWKVFLAFDEGEYHHGGNRDEDPVAKYTRPLIEQIVAEHGRTAEKGGLRNWQERFRRFWRQRLRRGIDAK
jgi:hypothetical protein